MKLAVLPEGKMKPFKLIVHNHTFSDEDLVINPKDFPSIRVGNILEIFHPEDDYCRLLLQVTSLKEDFSQKDAISVKQPIALTFQLRTYADIHVRVVNPKDVALDSLELTFKDQYLGRSDMWRLKKNLENTCVYLNKKIVFCGIRCEVYELWAQGDRVACGAVTEDTKIVFRSSTSQVYLFIQMSSEMWDTDINGDLYFEKAVNGFLADLFAKWKKNGSSHEVTIVLFSRTFYEAQSIEEFPETMRDCLQLDYKGRFYEDFYRVAVQNERYDDWGVILVELKRLFNNYPKSVLEYHQWLGSAIPKAVNSTAAQGNFLEVLNMSLNVFEKHYLDRSFDRTGQLSVVITPGVGVFEVDRELTNITKQRIIDNGVGSDLVCLGEQPLHAVPLFKFHNKNSLNAVDDYSMPHWINLSFYSSSKQVTYSNFVPRIKLPPMKAKTPKDTNKGNDLIARSKQVKHEDNTNFPSLFDYDAYDAQVFKLPSAHISGTHHTHSLQRLPSRKKSDQPPHQHQQKHVPPYRKFSEADISLFQNDINHSSLKRSSAVSIPTHAPDQSPLSSSIGGLTSEAVKVHHTDPTDEWEEELSPPARAIVGSAGSPYSPQANKAYLLRPGRALINPFDPSHVTIKLTSNRRRWTHVFPLGPTGIFMQQHHYQAIPQGTSSNSEFDRSKTLTSPLGHETSSMVTEPRRRRSLLGRRASESEGERDKENRLGNTPHGIEIPIRSRSTPSRNSVHGGDLPPDRSLTLLWGATGEQEWTPALTTGVDWKSLTIPACLPLTTDYFPDRRSLQNDYVLSDYTLLPDDVNAEIALQVGPSVKPLTPVEVFEELVSQRLQQGFQQIALPKPAAPSTAQVSSSPQYTPLHARSRTCTESEPSEEYLLSIGRIFHKVSLVGSTITVTCFRPRHPYPTLNIRYQYRFQAPDMDKYELSWVTFMSEKLESYNWNYLDHYICWRGQGDFKLLDSLKYWRFRMFLLPMRHQITKKILEDESGRCDIYQPLSHEEKTHLVDGFLKFLEVVNRIKKPFSNRKQRKSGTFVKPILARSGHQHTVVQGSSPSQFSGSSMQSGSSVKSFRDRGDSNRSMDRPRPRSGSKIIERVRSESGNGGRISPAADIIDAKPISSSSLSLDAGTTENLSGHAPESSEESLLGSETHRLSITSPLVEIVEAMKQPHNEGLSFLSRQQGLSSMTFISAEAVAWLMDRVDGVSSPIIAVQLLENMLVEGLICHASGNNYPLIYGFYLYYIVGSDKDQQDDQPEPFDDLDEFRKNWVEVAVKLDSLPASSFPVIPNHPTLTRLFSDGSGTSQGDSTVFQRKSVYNESSLEVDLSDKVNRAEWGHVRYHYLFTPNVVFEIAVQWMVATSSIITELAQNWSRKANPCGFHLIPVPSDPFALPYSYKSDPLRGPIFIPLDTEALLETVNVFVFKDITGEENTEQLFQFQESIAQRFGFLACLSEMGSAETENHYIHVSGYMFLMIPTRPKVKGIIIPGRKISQRSQLNLPVVSSPHEDYITRHVMGKSSKRVFEESSSTECRVGFLWSWNYMLSKRWKTSAAGDEQLMNKLFKDFRDFCQNRQNRLQDWWIKWQQNTIFPDKG